MSDPLATTVSEEWGRLTALLLALPPPRTVEDALGDAVEAATRTRPTDGVPDKPAARLHTAASRRIIDRLRSEATAQRAEPLLVVESARREGGRVMADPGALVEDDLLRLVLMCTHPSLAPEAASALTLRLVLGVPTPDIARLFLVPEPTMAARITRAKKKIVGAGIPFGVPDASVLPERLDTVAQTAYLAFTAGYAPGTGADLLRAAPAGEAILPGPLRAGAPTVRAGAGGAARADDLPALAPRCARPRRPPRAAARPGPHPVAPPRDRRGPAPGLLRCRPRTHHGAGCGLHPAGTHRRRARPRPRLPRRPTGSGSSACTTHCSTSHRRRARARPGRSR
ncbi:hypothetical protein LP418_22315 [Nocardioides sp. B-3]|nr:sigma factor-like helix-turn-helix DNA-binding protein [Nocardioides sp. B-3]UUZ58795.1 hypothetical protein LP418_22315 [Nocardioides sp. B-3]